MLSAILFPSLASSFRFRAKSNCHLRQVIKKPTPKIRKSMPKSHVLLAIGFANLLRTLWLSEPRGTQNFQLPLTQLPGYWEIYRLCEPELEKSSPGIESC
jgi:hypothetical protein